MSSRSGRPLRAGSLHVGDQSFASVYGPLVPASVRVANLCDFVPSLVSLEPVTPTDPYVHVGTEAAFVSAELSAVVGSVPGCEEPKREDGVPRHGARTYTPSSKSDNCMMRL